MRAHRPWLAQGDIFRSAPVVDVAVRQDGRLHVSLPNAPAILLTHDCAMDKPDAAGRPKLERLQFASLRSMVALEQGRQRNIRGRRRELNPSEVLYIGEVADLGESYILLSDPYYLPSAYFELRCMEYRNHPDAEEGGASYATPRDHDTRMGRLDDDVVGLLRRKMPAFWARVEDPSWLG